MCLKSDPLKHYRMITKKRNNDFEFSSILQVDVDFLRILEKHFILLRWQKAARLLVGLEHNIDVFFILPFSS